MRDISPPQPRLLALGSSAHMWLTPQWCRQVAARSPYWP
jgi:hypothetical protein